MRWILKSGLRMDVRNTQLVLPGRQHSLLACRHPGQRLGMSLKLYPFTLAVLKVVSPGRKDEERPSAHPVRAICSMACLRS